MICASYTSHMRGAYRYAPRILLCEAHIDMRLAYVKYRRRISYAPRIRNTRGLKREVHVICASDRLFGAPRIGFSLVVAPCVLSSHLTRSACVDVLCFHC